MPILDLNLVRRKVDSPNDEFIHVNTLQISKYKVDFKYVFLYRTPER